ncbi:MAG: protein kinase [Herpetosiphonaceae bacterium]|nr:protein kinase [Herpetosiphonaceae bacterium]
MQNLIDTYLGPYRLVEVIGRGSTSTVYQAYQRSLNRYVAIKVLLPSLDPQFTARFEHEAQLVAQLQHPNILPIYDYGEQSNQSYFVMQYIPNGLTLAHLMTGQPMEPGMALRLIISTLEGLGYAHNHGVIHRDIKPSNILLPSPNWPMLADWGIAKVTYDDRHLTPPGQTVGTAVYMAPERAKGQPADPRTDLYAVGIVLYELLTGKVPFDGPTPMTVLAKHIGQAPPSPRSLNPELPSTLEAVLLRALEKDPAQRFQRAEEMVAALQQVVIMHPLPVQPLPTPVTTTTPATGYETGRLVAPPVSAAPSTPRPGYRSGVGSRLAALALILAILAASAALLLNQRQRVVAEGGRPTSSTATTTQATVTQGLVVLTTTTATDTAPVPPDPEATLAPAATLLTLTTVTPSALPTTIPPVVIDVPTQLPTTTTEPPTLVPVAPVVATPVVPTAVPVVPTAKPAIPTAVLVATARPTAVAPAPPAASPLPAGPLMGRIEDTEWRGGYVRPGHAPYKGHTATWIYGTNTPYQTMATTILLPLAGQPQGTASLLIYGMDSEGAGKTLISISVNGQQIYNGLDPLPNDDDSSPAGNWGSYTWTFNAGLIHNGPNTITISNLSPGRVGLPPWFMLDYADLSFVAP